MTKNFQNNLLAPEPPEHVSKGDAGTAATQASQHVAEERKMSAAEEARADIIGTPADTDGRYIPMGEAVDDMRVRELSRYFDIPGNQYKDTAVELSEMIKAVNELTGFTAMTDILVTLNEWENVLKPAGNAPRWLHMKNYLLEKLVENDVRQKVRAFER